MALEQVFLAQPVPAAGGRIIVSPFQFAVDGDDHLLIEGWNTVTGCALNVIWRFAEIGQAVKPYQRTLALTADRVVSELVVPLGVGYLVNLAVFASGANPRVGQTFVCIKLQRGLGAAALTLGLLVQGYVTAEQGLGWPGSPIEDSIAGGGVIRSFIGTNPGFQSEISETVPTGARWQLLNFAATLTTGADVRNRRPVFGMVTAAAEVYRSAQPGTMAANSAARWFWAVGLAHEVFVAGDARLAGLPTEAILLSGDSVFTVVDTGMASDDWAAPVLLVREWLEVDD